MRQDSNRVNLEIENRRPGLWIVAGRAPGGGAARVYTVEIGREQATWEFTYRVTSVVGALSHLSRNLQDALELCRSLTETAR
jgi:hypothetical protein